MTDTPPDTAPNAASATPSPVVEEKRRRISLSAVWLVPLVAVLIALAIAWQSYRDRGELIAITFPDASGVTIGETTLRFREVVIGVVEDVGFSSDLASVNVYVRVNREIAPYLDEDASFWIVQPSVTTRGVEGLGTILSGTYIEGTWDSEAGEAATVFVGNDRAPIVPPGVDGTAIALRASDGARLSAGAPIIYRGIQVGEVASPRLSSDGTEVRIDAFVRAPYDRQITTATRFWDASGVSASFGGSGFELDVGSIAAILEGGLVFDTLISGGESVDPGYVFEVFEDRQDALASTFEAPSSRAVRFAAVFPSAASGLTEGSAVRYQGIRVGAVTAITGFVRPDDPTGEVQLLAVLAVQPGRMGLDDVGTSDIDAIDYVDDLVRRGLRAQLVSTSLFGGELAVDLTSLENAPETVGLEIGVADNPLIPTVEGDTDSITASAEGVLSRINELPIEELLLAATDLLENVNRVAADPSTRAIPSAALAAIEQGGGLARDARSIVASPQTAGVLANLQAISADLRVLTARATEREIADRLADLTETATRAAANVETATEPSADLARRATVVIDEAGRILSSEEVQAIPGLVEEAVAAGRTILTSPAIAEAVTDVAAITGDVRALTGGLDAESVTARIDAALSSIDTAARNVAEGTGDLGDLRSTVNAAVEAARALLASPEVEALPASLRATLSGAEGLVADLRGVTASPDMQAIPEVLTAILADVDRAADGLRSFVEGVAPAETSAQVAALIDTVETVAGQVAEGTADLSTLRASIDAVIGGAEGLLASPDTQALPGSARRAISGADAFVGDLRALLATPEIQELLQDLPAISGDIRAMTQTLADGQAALALTSALQAAERAAVSLAEGAEGLPALSQRSEDALVGIDALTADLSALASKANDLALDDLVDATTQLMRSADVFISSDEADDVPVVLVNTLEEVRRAVETVRTGGTLDNLNATLTSASGAAETIRTAAGDLPALVGRLRALTDSATGVLSTYDSESRVAQELFATLRAATRAAEDVSSLSRTIERNPNSLLLGR